MSTNYSFVIRPDMDPNNEGEVKEVASDITDWVLAHRERVPCGQDGNLSEAIPVEDERHSQR